MNVAHGIYLELNVNKRRRKMYKKDDHNSFMMLGLVNTLKNKGAITEEDRKDILNLGEFVEEWNQITKAKEILANLNERLKKGKF